MVVAMACGCGHSFCKQAAATATACGRGQALGLLFLCFWLVAPNPWPMKQAFSPTCSSPDGSAYYEFRLHLIIITMTMMMIIIGIITSSSSSSSSLLSVLLCDYGTEMLIEVCTSTVTTFPSIHSDFDTGFHMSPHALHDEHGPSAAGELLFLILSRCLYLQIFV